MKAPILVVDDEADFRELMVKRLSRKGYGVSGAATGEEALALVQDRIFDVALVDLKMPGMDGLALLGHLRAVSPETEVIILTGHGTTETAVEAMKMGAYDYLTKPVDLQELQVLIEKAAEKAALRRKNFGLTAALAREHSSGFHGMLGHSPAMVRLRTLIGKVADSSSPVLVEGESGTGKEMVSRALHFTSHRAKAPFIVVNCGALPEQLMESELFGHAKGAFTGAQATKPGLVEMADGGSLFLDEIGELPLGLQAKLLRFLESGEFRRVGDTRLRWVQTRIIAATNRNLQQEVEAGRFREDLFYRLAVVKIHVPPLRERKEDVPLLANFFLKKHHPDKELAPEALQALQEYDFPGNVRELANLVERGALLCEGKVVRVEDMFGGAPPAAKDGPPESLAEVEKRHIQRVLDYTGWDKKKAAAILGISLRSLYRKIEGYGLHRG